MIHAPNTLKSCHTKPKMSAGNKEMRLVLSSDAKPRLRWTSELHQQFVGAVEQLGGAEKATPKSLMRVMGVDGLTLYHLKSHLQKYRMGRSNQNKQENCVEKTSHHSTTKTICDGAKENLQMTRALQMQMEVQRKLHEQIEVQKHLQLRVEAQGKYLQTVLRKAQETICEYGSCSIEAENARAQLAELVSMVDSTCPASELALNDARNEALGHHGSVESSLTSTSEGSTQRYQLQEREEGSLLSLSLRPAKERKRSVDESDRVDHESKRVALVDTIDLNCNDVHSVPRFIDLNS